MPDFDFDAFNHDQPEGGEDPIPEQTTPDTTSETPTENSDPGSSGAGEDVDKW